jgi:hypothetical protein
MRVEAPLSGSDLDSLLKMSETDTVLSWLWCGNTLPNLGLRLALRRGLRTRCSYPASATATPLRGSHRRTHLAARPATPRTHRPQRKARQVGLHLALFRLAMEVGDPRYLSGSAVAVCGRDTNPAPEARCLSTVNALTGGLRGVFDAASSGVDESFRCNSKGSNKVPQHRTKIGANAIG